jgi:Na+-translocating ferredoxin:NAD+ oxidoreductase subunit C
VPDPIAELRACATPSELLVPLPVGARLLPAGTTLRGGDSLLREPVRHPAVTPLAPLAGVLIGTRGVRLTSGRAVDAAVIKVAPFSGESAPRLTPIPFREHVRGLLQATASELAAWPERLTRAGLSADRPTCPDLHRQLADSAGVDTVILTVLDPDQHLGVCAQLADESGTDLLIAGVLLARLCAAGRLLLVIEPTTPDRAKRELARLGQEVARTAAELSVPLSVRAISYTNHYPTGDTSLLVRRLLGRAVPPDALPTSRGVLLLDTAAAAALGRVIRLDLPTLLLPLAVGDHVTGKCYLLRTPIGTPLSHILRCTGVDSASSEIRAGDVLRERIVPADAVITSDDLYLHAIARPRLSTPDPCVRCGWCVEACPTRVNPAEVLEAAQTRDVELAARAGLSACIECGLCQYVCPSRLPLLSAIRSIKPVPRHGGGGGK